MPAEGTAAIWYVSRDGNQFGPVSFADLEKLYRTGRVVPNDHVWSPHLGEWKRAAEILEAFPSAARPPAPPKNALNQADRLVSPLRNGTHDDEPTQARASKVGSGIGRIIKVALGALFIVAAIVGIWQFIVKGSPSDQLAGTITAPARTAGDADDCFSSKSASCFVNQAIALVVSDSQSSQNNYYLKAFLRVARSSTDDETFFAFARNTLVSLSNNPSMQSVDNARLSQVLFVTGVPSLMESAVTLNPSLNERLKADTSYQCEVQQALLKKGRYIELPAKFQEYFALSKGGQCSAWAAALKEIESPQILRALLSIAPNPYDKAEVAKRILAVESDRAAAIAIVRENIKPGEYSYLEKAPALRNEPLASAWELRFFDNEVFLNEMLNFANGRFPASATSTRFRMSPEDRKEFLRLLSTTKFEKARPYAEQVTTTLQAIANLDGMKDLATTSCKNPYSDFCAVRIGIVCELAGGDQEKAIGEFLAARVNDAFLAEKGPDKPGTSNIGDLVAIFCPKVALEVASSSVLHASVRRAFVISAARKTADAGSFDRAYKMIEELEPSPDSSKYYALIGTLLAEVRAKGASVLQARNSLVKAVEKDSPGRLLASLLDEPLLVKDVALRIDVVRYFMGNDINFVINFVTWEKVGSGLNLKQKHDLISSTISMKSSPERLEDYQTAVARACRYAIDIDDAANLPLCLNLLPNSVAARAGFLVALADRYSSSGQPWKLYKPIQIPLAPKTEANSKPAPAASAARSIEGKWVVSSGGDKATMEFISGGTFLMSHNSEVLTGRWEALPENRFVLRGEGLAALNGSKVCNYRFESNDLVISGCFLAVRAQRL